MHATLPSNEHLALLQAMDRTHRWWSLDDKRVCVICEQIFSGRDVRFQQCGRLGYSLHCPTLDCPGEPPHWLEMRPRENRDRLPEGAGTGQRSEFSFL